MQVALGHPDLSEAFQTERLSSGGSEVVVKLAGFGEFARGEFQVARQECGFADQRAGKGDGAQRTAALRGGPQPAGHVDHLAIRGRPVQQVLGRAQVSVEDRVCDLRGVAGAAQFVANLVEPLAAPVG